MSPPSRRTFALLCLLFFSLLQHQSLFAAEDHLNDPLVKGKAALDRGDFYIATILLTAGLDLHPLIGDYALFWRAKANRARGEYSEALADLAELRNRYPSTPLLRQVRREEAGAALAAKTPSRMEVLKDYVRDHPSDHEMSLQYAYLLREDGSNSQAKKIFKEIYLSPSPLADKALAALDPADITQADLYRRGQNLNNSWMFRESERVLREALARDGRELVGKIKESLAYSLFRQKRYPEAADLYGEAGSAYWRARSLLRAGRMNTFEAELETLTRSKDSRMASVLINYAARKRRQGDTDGAVRILDGVLTRYPAAREETLWALGWTRYRAGDFAGAGEVFARLSSRYTNSKYDYWAARSAGKLRKSTEQSPAWKKQAGRDFYYHLSVMQGGGKSLVAANPPSRRLSPAKLPERVVLLRRLDLRSEAASEILLLSKKAGGTFDPVSLAAALNELGEYHSSIALIAGGHYSEGIHDLYYPRGFWQEVADASRRHAVDPALIAAVIREESRFDRRARSIAGALGLMQLMPETARRISGPAGVAVNTPDDLFIPATNISLGSYYLHRLMGIFGSLPPALAAYNAGEEVVRGWIETGGYETMDEFIEDIPYDETRNYVKKVLVSFFEYLRRGEGADAAQVRSLMGRL